MTGAPSPWRPSRTALLRSAGFPFSWLTDLAYEPLQQAFQRVATTHVELSALRRKLVAQLRAKGARRNVKFRRLTGSDEALFSPDLLCAWNGLVEAYERHWKALEEAWLGSREHEDAQLLLRLNDRTVRDSLLLMSLGAYQGLTAQADAHRLKPAGRRVAFRYLQRFCGKAETIGPSGPLNLLDLRAPEAQPASPERYVFHDRCLGEITYTSRGDGSAATRRSLLTFWAAEALLGTLPASAFPADVLCAQRILGVVDGPGMLTGDERRLLALADGSVTVAEMAVALRTEASEVLAMATRLQARSLVRLGVPIGGHEGDAGSRVRQVLQGVGAEQRAQAIGILDGIERFATTEADRPRELVRLAAQFEAASGKPAWRGGGEFYSDRMILVEEAYGNIVEARGGGGAQLAQRLQPALDLLASVAIAHRLRGQEMLRAMLRDRGTTSLPAAEVRRLAVSAPAAAPAMPEAFGELLVSDRAVVEISRSDLVAAGLIRSDLLAWPLFAAADVMLLGAPDSHDTAEVVLSEIHHVWPQLGHPTRELYGDERLDVADVRRSLTDLVAPARPLVQQVRRWQRGTDTSAAGQHLLCLAEIERGGFEGALAVDDLVVRQWANGFVGLHSPEDGADYWLLPEYDDAGLDVGGLMHCATPALDLPRVTTGTHTPRIVVDGVVLQRRRWDPPISGIPLLGKGTPSVSDWCEVRLWQSRLGMPRHVFFLTDLEPKPMWMDFEAVVSVANFSHAARRASRVTLSEMLPRPEALWLNTQTGRLASEIRILFTRNRPASDSWQDVQG